MTISHWRRSESLGTIECDVLVVGAGVCGLSAALHLERRGLRVAVAERHEIAAGASSRNAGFLMRGAACNYSQAVQTYGRERAKLVWRWTEENLAGLRGEGIEALSSYRSVPSCILALEKQEHEELLQSVALLREDSFEVGWADRGTDAAWQSGRALGGLINPRDAACNPVELMRLLAGRLKGPIHPHQEVAEIDEGASGPVRVRLTDAVAHAERVLLCTNAYASLLAPSLAGVVLPRRGQMLAFAHPAIRLDCSYYANHGYEYFRQAADGWIVVGGCRKLFADQEIGYDDVTTPEVQQALERFACAMFAFGSDELRVTARWAGTMGFSPDGLPLIGPVSRDWPSNRVWFCGAYTGHGMSMAYRTAQAAVASMLDGAPNPFPLARLGQV